MTEHPQATLHVLMLVALTVLSIQEYLYVFLPSGVFLSCDHGLHFDIALRDGRIIVYMGPTTYP